MRRIKGIAVLVFCVLFIACGFEEEGHRGQREDNLRTEGEGRTEGNLRAEGEGQREDNLRAEGEGRTESSLSEESEGMENQGEPKQNGTRKTDQEGKYFDLMCNTTQIFDMTSSEFQSAFQGEEGQQSKHPGFMGLQFYQDEPVLLCAIEQIKPNGEERSSNVYLCREDGTSELLFDSIPSDLCYGCWLLDEEGNAYVFKGRCLWKIDAEGQMVYEREYEHECVAKNLCRLPDGRMYMFGQFIGEAEYKLFQIEPVKGTISVVMDDFSWSRSPCAIGEGKNNSLLFMDYDGIWALNPSDKSKETFLLFEGTSYYEDYQKKRIQGFRVAGDGSIEVLRSDGRFRRTGGMQSESGTCDLEILQLVDVGEEKIPIVMRGLYFNSKWMKDQVVRFNQSQQEYYVVLDEWLDGTDEEEFIRKTGVEIATGRGPDIICGELLEESIYNLVQRGVFEDLKPYMDKSGLREEDYFPLAFSSWREGDKVYSINSFVMLEGFRIDESVLGSREEPGIEALVDALLGYEENVFYLYNTDSMDILRMFMEGSENLWGMVDWEKRTCDFSGELFAKLLKTAQRYGYDKRFHYPAIAQRRSCSDIVLFDSEAEQIEEGMVTSGVMFDDGCHAAARAEYFILSMSASSSHKEGAWEFLNFLLGEESQYALKDQSLPVYKEAFDATAAEILANKDNQKGAVSIRKSLVMVEGEMITVYERSVNDLSEEKIAELRKTIEEAKPIPIRTGPIMDIICEEAADYFSGYKNIEEVRLIIENRVRLYLEENN